MTIAQDQEQLACCQDEVNSGNQKVDVGGSSPIFASQDRTDNALIESEFSASIDVQDGVGCCHPSTRLHRYFVLFFMCFLAFGSYFCYDNPGTLESQIEADLNISGTAFSNFYSWYSYPNVILSFFGGFLIDTVFGIRMGTIIFAGLICIGQVIFAGGALVDNFYVMVLGRFVFGLGGESLAVAQNTYSVLWFKGKELNTVFGVQLSVARLGSVANMNSMPYLYDYIQESYKGSYGLGIALMIAGLVCLFSLFCAMVVAYYDRRAERILVRESSGSGEVIQFSDIKRFPMQFWLLCIICAFYYSAITPFISIAGKYLISQYNMTVTEADRVTSIPYTVSAIVSPFCGLLCDLTGMNLLWTIVAGLISTACHLAFSYLPIGIIPPSVTMGVLGVGFSLFACAFWPMVAMLVPEHQLGTAYGAMQSVQNLGLAVVIQSAEMLREAFPTSEEGLQWSEVYFMLWISLSLVLGFVLQMHNTAKKGALNPPLYRKRICGRGDEVDDREALLNQD
ncbi:major facilitator superfamily domain-containing protein 1 [Galendromus occidentalis]|uniref:Lysosomal dipeptide transporter MFSD1 n=1 Tax=Galendromus occidentalis TaxID=34638 RepID=A0AAJ6QVK3_9ACAR|nr:major facilitator superfamily domain-containing protein 1 [Galendromus occidentalis]